MIGLRDPEARAAYGRDGYVVLPALTDEELAGLRRAWSELDGPRPPGKFAVTSMSSDEGYRRAVDAALRAVLGPVLTRLTTGYVPLAGLFNHKGDDLPGTVVDLHQDWSFVDEPTHDSFALWCPLVPATSASGGLLVLPGSHRLNPHPRPANIGYATPYATLLPEMGELLVPLDVDPGQVVLFSHRLFHASGPNFLGTERPVATLVCVPEGARTRIYLRRGDDLEVIGVDRDALMSFQVGVEEPRGPSLGRVPYTWASVGLPELRAMTSPK